MKTNMRKLKTTFLELEAELTMVLAPFAGYYISYVVCAIVGGGAL